MLYGEKVSLFSIGAEGVLTSIMTIGFGHSYAQNPKEGQTPFDIGFVP
eukprot:gene13988-11538_t